MMYAPRRALILGKGFVGLALADYLINTENFTSVHLLGRGTINQFRCQNITESEGDISAASLSSLGECNYSVIFYCAGDGSIAASEANHPRAVENNLLSLVSALDYCAISKVSTRFVYCSSAAVYGNYSDGCNISESAELQPCSFYGLLKKQAEELCLFYKRNYLENLAIARIFSVYGPGLKKQLFWDALAKLHQKRFSFGGGGHESRDWIYIKDLCAVLSIMGQSTCTGIFNVGTGNAVQVKDALSQISLMYSHVTGAGYMEPEFDGLERVGNPVFLVADISKTIQTLGWKPRMSLSEGLLEYVKWGAKN